MPLSWMWNISFTAPASVSSSSKSAASPPASMGKSSRHGRGGNGV